MHRGTFVLTAVLLVGFAASTAAESQDVEGTWKLSNIVGGVFEQSVAIVKLKSDGGKTTGELVASDPRIKDFSLQSVTQDGNLLRIVIKRGKVESVFEANMPKEAGKQIVGALVSDGAVTPAVLAMTKESAINPKTNVRMVPCPPAELARSLANRAALLPFQATKAKDDEKKKKLLKQAAEAVELAKTQVPKLHREVLAKFPDSPAVFDSALSLMKSAQSSEAKIAEVKSWAATGAKSAKAYGPAWQKEFTMQTAAALVGQEGFAPLALDYAREVEGTVTAKTPPAEEHRILSLVTRALKKSGKEDDAKKYDGRIAKLDEILDRAYLAKMPAFKGETFTGRKIKSERAVVMELFTGAMCPPCVAADLAFDVLQSTYQPSELVMIQYHMHIPGPDPMTNPDTEARWKYYGEAFPDDIRGVPSSLFNGKPLAGGGGGWDDAAKKYGEYRETIDPLLEEATTIKLAAKTQRKGDKIDINVDVAGVKDPGSDKKLRILLAEHTVKYAGSNKIRMHHNVVRAFPGGVDGIKLTQGDSKHTASIQLDELRGRLTKYLNDFEVNVRSFANPARPLAFEHLRVIALVQDDKTQEILQAVQVDVAGK